MRGESEREKAYVPEEGFYEAHQIELLRGTAVTAIDPGGSRGALEDARELAYDLLLLAMGAEPRLIPVPGAKLDGVYYLRTLADCEALRACLDAGGHVVVVGAGWIGSEVAASTRQRGLEVTMVDPLKLPNERIFGQEIGAATTHSAPRFTSSRASPYPVGPASYAARTGAGNPTQNADAVSLSPLI